MELTPAEDAAVRGTVVLLHGLGATLEDLVSVVEDMRFPARHLLFDGTFPMEMGEHYQGRAWYQKNGTELTGLEESVRKLRESLNMLGAHADHSVVVGFSQGAAMALSVVLDCETTPAGLCMLSGYIPQLARLDARRERIQNLYALLFHGTHDEVVPFSDGLVTLNALSARGARARLVAQSTGHWIPVEAVVELRRFLDERLPK
jgi:predicted esterase